MVHRGRGGRVAGGRCQPDVLLVVVGVVASVVALVVEVVAMVVVLGGNGGDIGGGGKILFMSNFRVPSASNVVALSQLSSK